MKYAFSPRSPYRICRSGLILAQRRTELAQAFIDAVEEAIYRIRESPTRCPVMEQDIRRCLTGKFPYAILYTIEPDYLLILAVMHCNREPGYWKTGRA